jgi:DNA-binding NtrC family response regulator
MTENPNSIWIIDDDKSIRWVLEKTLTNDGYQVTAFESASVALTRFKRSQNDQRPQLILTDVRMPGIDGFELLKQIKNISPQTAVIVMTAYSDLDSTMQGFQDGAFEFLAKPFDIDDTLKLVARACNPATEVTLGNTEYLPPVAGDWETQLRFWARQQLAHGEKNILAGATRIFQRALLESALEATNGRKQEAAGLLGWGRNTLTRKLKELGVNPE